MAQPQPLLGRIEQGPQQQPLPFVPHARPDRADVDDGQDQQQPQPLRALHLGDEILDRLGVGEVALERGRRHQQMMAHQPGDGLGLGRIEPEARAELQRDLGADHAMVAAAALGDVVQQHRDVEHPARRDLAEQGGRQRMIVGFSSPRSIARQQPDRADRMLVDGIMVVHVELHLRDDAAEVGNEAAEHAGLVHPAQHHFGSRRDWSARP